MFDPIWSSDMTQPLQMAGMETILGRAQDADKAMPSPEAVSRFQALMQQADVAAPTTEPSGDMSALSKIVGTHDVQMEQVLNDVDALQHNMGSLSPGETAAASNLVMTRMASLNVETTVAMSFATSTKGSIETLLKNQ
ncbi:type III secretion protein SctI [Mycetohabitans sp. B7]|nr:type III secretion protein SctI [Mycetohabitans sp. B3]MCG1039506.1 type III secretion protein SctI [Mycetohabitans sp. B7]